MADSENKEPKIEIKKPQEGDDKTAKIPKPSKAMGEDKKVVLNSSADSAIRPSDATRMAPSAVPPPPPGAEETVAMDKDEIKDIPVIAKTDTPAPPSVDDSTQKTIKPPAISPTAKSKTIKLKPLKPNNQQDKENQEETLSLDRDALLDKDMPAINGLTPPEKPQTPGLEDEATIKIEKPVSTKPSHPIPSSTIPGAKETIKLRPSNATPPPPGAAAEDESQETIAMSKKTIRLVPKKTDDTSTQKTAKPSAPTVKLDAPGAGAPPAPAAPPAAAAPPPAAPSAPTVKVPEPAKPAASGKRTLKLKSSAKTVEVQPPAGDGAPPPPADTGSAPAAAKTKQAEASAAPDKSADPNVVFTLVACVAFILMAYFTWAAIGSWAEIYQDTKTANVPMLSGTLKPAR